MVQLVERKVRSRARQIYETRGEAAGQELQDWFQAESEVLGKSILGPMYRRLKTGSTDRRHDNDQSNPDFSAQDSACENPA